MLGAAPMTVTVSVATALTGMDRTPPSIDSTSTGFAT
jgi:hypothetical protein